MDVIPTGCYVFDRMIRGGFPVGQVALVYGEASTGKTTMAVQCAINCARRGFKTLFIDSDNAFPPNRLSQIAQQELSTIAPYILLFTPQNFKEQVHIIESLTSLLTSSVALVVVDTINSLYRVELGSSAETFALNRELNRQLAYLVDIARTKKVVVLLTSQVHSIIGELNEVEPLAMRVLNFHSRIVINLRKTAKVGVIDAVLKKFLGMRNPRARSQFKLTETGIQDVGR